eukprot:Selendium_serpulae@DN5475_c0_g1_i1.p1
MMEKTCFFEVRSAGQSGPKASPRPTNSLKRHSMTRLHVFYLVVMGVAVWAVGLGCTGTALGEPPSEGSCAVEPDLDCRHTFPNSLLIRGASVVTAAAVLPADVLVRDGLVHAIRRRGSRALTQRDADDALCAERVVDADGMFLLPGGVDPHTHLEMPFMGTVTADDFDSGHQAAAAGGTTTHIDFALPDGASGSLVDAVDAWHGKARGKARIDYGLHVAVTAWSERVGEEMEILVRDRGVSSFKFFMAYKGALMVDDAELIQGMKRAKQLGALSMVHAENGDAVAEGQRVVADELRIRGPEGHALSRPAALEAEATNRAATFAAWLGAPLYVVHVMCREAAEAVKRAKESGAAVFAEATLGGLFLDQSAMWATNFTWAAAHVMSPPLRSHQTDGTHLIAALATNDIQVVGTDHAVFTSAQKRRGAADFRLIPNGINGLQERLPVLWARLVRTGRLSPPQFVRATATNAAKIFNIYPVTA